MIRLVRTKPISPKLGETNRKKTTVLQISFISGSASETVISHYLYLYSFSIFHAIRKCVLGAGIRLRQIFWYF